MAANDYYNPTPSYHIPAVDFDTPPPPPPASDKPSNREKTSRSKDYMRPVSPTRSPFDDYTHATASYPPTPPEPGRVRRQYSGSHAADGRQQDPYADNVPLRDYPADSGAGRSGGKNGQTGFQPEMENGGFPPNDNPNMPPKKKGRFGRRRFNPMNPKDRTPWFVYIMTLIQVTVFVVELVQNCKCSTTRSHPLGLDRTGPNRIITDSPRSYSHQISHRRQTPVQPHDRTVESSVDCHGGEVSTLHAIHARGAGFEHPSQMALSQHDDDG